MASQTLSDIPVLRGPVAIAHLFLRNFVHAGDKAVDATCGNGCDTLLLAELAGLTGHVWGFDIQEQAIAETGRRLTAAGLHDQVTLLHVGHEGMEQHMNGPVKAVVFNLGYLPGSDRTVITHPETTMPALDQSLKLLVPDGILMVTVYPGHGGGSDEQRAVDDWATGLPKEFRPWRLCQMNVAPDAPYCILIQKGA